MKPSSGAVDKVDKLPERATEVKKKARNHISEQNEHMECQWYKRPAIERAY